MFPTSITKLLTVVSMMAMTTVPCTGAPYRVWVANLVPISGSGTSVTGAVAVFEATPTRVAYAGFALSVTPNLGPADCTAGNACGVHIHEGTSCDSSTTQGGHYFESPVTVDPWTDKRYDSGPTGRADYEGILEMGTNDIEGRAFIVHNESGGRVACGLLTEVTEDALSAVTDPLSGSGVTGLVTVITDVGASISDGMECFYGTAEGLTINLDADSGDCDATNGCGAHIHDGSGCESSNQGGHYFAFPPDPWATVGYTSTDSTGDAEFVHCVSTGEMVFAGKPFLIHKEDGNRVACGVLEPEDDKFCL